MSLLIPRLDGRLLPPDCRNTDEIKAFVTKQFARHIGQVAHLKIGKTHEYRCFTLVIDFKAWYTTEVARELQRTIRAQRTKASVEYHPDGRNRWFWIVEEKCDETYDNTDNVGEELMRADGDPNTCAICIESQHEHTHSRLECGHCFHKACIKAWFKRSTTCPMCRCKGSWFDMMEEEERDLVGGFAN